MATVIRIHQFGGPETLKVEDAEVGKPGPGEVRLRQTVVGVNYIDTYHRSGLYPIQLPSGIGMEAAGLVEEVGPGVQEFAPGDRAAYAMGAPGSYATHRLCKAEQLVKIPDSISDETAAAAMLQGMTAEYLLRRCARVQPGETILFHAAAGGVGLIACQWAKALGVTVIGTVSTDAKAELAKANGCTHVVVTRREDFVARVKEITGGKKVICVFDGVGKDTFMGSLDCLRPRGMLVSFGNASGAVPAFEPNLLSAKGSLYLTRPSLAHYIATRAELLDSSAALFGMIGSGKVKIEVAQRFALKDAANAHRALESRATVGSSVLIP